MSANAASAVIPAAKAVEEAYAPRRGGWTCNDVTVVWAIGVIEKMGILARLGIWKDEQRKGPGGRPETFPLKALLVAMVLCARESLPMLATTFRDVLFNNISAEMRHELGVPEPPDEDDHAAWMAAYRNVRTRLHGMLDLMDPSPFPKDRRLTPEEFKARTKNLSPERIEELDRRLLWFANQVIEASVLQLPRSIRRRWKGSVAVDATPIPGYARPEHRGRATSKHGKRPVLTHSTDPDCAWYVREADHRDPETVSEVVTGSGKRIGRISWAFEATLVVMGSDDPSGDGLYPNLVVAMAPLHKPGHDPGENAIRALTSVYNRGHPRKWLAGDLAYTNALAEKFQLPARALYYLLVLDYRYDQLGVQGSYGGALLIEGWWYCPSIPPLLIAATMDYRNGHIDKATWRQRLEARRAYRFRPRAHPDGEGHVRLMCPAAGACPSARCELKPASESDKTAGKTRIFLVDDVRHNPCAVCGQDSMTFPPEVGAKFLQELLYGTEEWSRVYSTLRNTIEGFNGLAKDHAYEALGDAGRRRIRGVAAQTVFVAFLIFGANMRKIDSFLNLCVIDDDGVARRPRPPRRKTRSLAAWLPEDAAASGDPPDSG